MHSNGPGLLVDEPEPLVEMFVRDIEKGVADTGVRAGMLKVVTDRPGMTPDVERVMVAAAKAHQQHRRSHHDAHALATHLA